MNISSPYLPGHIKKSLSSIINALYDSALADRNADLQIDILGVLSYTIGAKLRLSYVDSINDQDICEWNYIARQYGAINVTSQVDTGKGQIQLNIEYKSAADYSTNKTLWIFRLVLTAITLVSYYQLHLLRSDKYPFPSEWLT
jgi:hypothetical protein